MGVEDGQAAAGALRRKLNLQAVYGLHTIDQDAMGDRDA